MRDADQIDGGFGDTSSVAAILANTPVKRRPTIASALDPRSRTDALAGWCVQLRQHLPRGPRCQPRPQPPATPTTWLVSSAAFAMAAPLAALASAFDAPSAPTPTATMAAASNARIWFSCFWPTRSAARQIRRTPADPPVTRASAARTTARVDCHSRLNVRKLLGNAQACIRCGKASGAAGGGWSRST